MSTSLQITWLAFYPKSGNTWMRFLLYSYFYGNIDDSHEVGLRIPDIHALPGQRIAQGAHGSHLCNSSFGVQNQQIDIDN